jgi:hypothetical protein
VLYASHLAKLWIKTSAQPSLKSSSFLPSTPQYLLSVGILGQPGVNSLWKSVRYCVHRRMRTSPILSHPTALLALLIIAAGMIVGGDIWLHIVSSSVLENSILQQDNPGNFSFAFAPATGTQAPWQLQQGLKTFLDANPSTAVIQLDDTMIIVPHNLPPSSSVLGATFGVQVTCQAITPTCTLGQSAATFDCSSLQPGATGAFGAVNVTFFPSGNNTTFNVIAAMELPSLFNETSTIRAAQIFGCLGSLVDITYLFANGDFSIAEQRATDFAVLKTLWNLDAFAGKRTLIQSVLNLLGTSAIWVQGTDVISDSNVFANGLAKIFASFLAGETTPVASSKVFL